jgi:opacity protein-like surface antigen
MKKLLFAALIAVSFSASAFATDVNQIDGKAMENFKSAYAGASNVQWILKGSFTKASFYKNDEKVEVFYNLDGDFIAATTQVKMDKLPTSVKRFVAKNYSDYTVQEGFKFEADGATNYFIAAENEKENIVLQAKGGLFSVYSRTAKS